MTTTSSSSTTALQAFVKESKKKLTWISENTGIGYPRLNRILRGQKPTEEEVVALCGALGVPPGRLFSSPTVLYEHQEVAQ